MVVAVSRLGCSAVAAAHTCHVSVELNGDLRLTIRDDGPGLPASPPGVELASMRDRAEELGRTCRIIFTEGEGTCVEALLPVATP
jgi:two-component system, NarL family, sensor kinase